MAIDDTETGSDLERIVAFSDAVIAIAITLLVLDIRLPAMPEQADSAALVAALIAIAPKIAAYVLSFLVIGQFWYVHHQRFHSIRRYDRRLIWLNLLFLMVIGFVPFASAVLSEHPVAAAYALYDATMASIAFLSAALWGYAIAGDRLVDPGLDPRIRRQSLESPLLVAGVFVLAGLVAQNDVQASRWVWLLLIPAAIWRGRRKLGRRN
ncbi:MAG: TMEM175 family protein [Beijerinckiaceae bacterium]